MKSRGLIKHTLILILVTILFSCNVTKLIPEGSHLVTKNSIHINYADSVPSIAKIRKSAPLGYIPLSQTPNGRIFGMDLRTWWYLKSDINKNNWGNKALRKIGKAPVYYDSLQTDLSVENMRLYMQSMGFLDASISAKVNLKNQKAFIDYYIETNNAYIIDSVSYVYNDTEVEKYIANDSLNFMIKKGDIFTRELLEAERVRIAKSLNNKGFYSFVINDIDYLVDTTHSSKLANVNVNIHKFRDEVNHKIYKINSVNIYPDYVLNTNDSLYTDSVNLNDKTYYFRGKKESIKVKSIDPKIRLMTDDVWTPLKVENTTRDLLNMTYVKTSTIDFRLLEVPDSSAYGYLDADIKLIPAKKYGIKAEGEISSNSNYTSVIARLGYSNKNIFKHSEFFDITFNTAYDLFYNRKKKDAYQFGVKTSLSFPKLLVPFRLKPDVFIHDIRSSIKLSYDIQNRPDYRRHIASTSFGYSWSNGKNLDFYYNPATLTYIDLPWISKEYYESITNPYLRNTYTNQVIAGTNFGLVYKKENKIGSSYVLKTNVETAGNTLYVGAKVFGANNNTNDEGENFYDIFGIRFAQYGRLDMDFSYKYNFTSKLAVVSRFNLGIGTGYGNSNSMPFERLFYSGGNSSMRGWQIRALGPGNKMLTAAELAYPNSLGDIKLELNLEGRFAIWGPLRGAVFFDLGNIWSNGRGETNEDAIFYFDRFYKQLGFNTGVGLRVDLSFFILRLDWGIILHDPNKLEGNRWIHDFDINNTALHFSIGYPF